MKQIKGIFLTILTGYGVKDLTTRLHQEYSCGNAFQLTNGGMKKG